MLGLVITTDYTMYKKEFGEPMHETVGKVLGGYVEHVLPIYMPHPFCLLVDEEGKLKKGPVSINCLASDLYGADRHGDAIVGNVMIVRAEDERLTLLTKDEADVLATGMEAKRDQAVEKISAAFGLKPIVKPELEIVDLSRRQSCRKNSMER